jgi:hypothetical protein
LVPDLAADPDSLARQAVRAAAVVAGDLAQCFARCILPLFFRTFSMFNQGLGVLPALRVPFLMFQSPQAPLLHFLLLSPVRPLLQQAGMARVQLRAQ